MLKPSFKNMYFRLSLKFATVLLNFLMNENHLT